MTRLDDRIGSIDVVGLGALNVDLIASASRLSKRAEERISESTSRFEFNTEGPVDEEVITRAVAQLGAHALEASLGGSAWNAIFALASMDTGLNLGFMGVLGKVEVPGVSFTRQMALLEIDDAKVRRSEAPAGTCLSFIEDDRRVLLTSPSANLELAAYIQDNIDDLSSYLSRARLVHVTSLLDAATPLQMLALLRRAKALNPNLILSFDPGYEWTREPTQAVRGILALSDLVFVNYQEFKALSSYAHGELDDVLGRRVAEQCGASAVIFVTKRYDLVEVFSRRALDVKRFTYTFADPGRDIEDATGAGDIFAASVIAAMLAGRLHTELGGHLGLSLARHKLRYRAAAGHSRFPDLTRGFLQTEEKDDPGQSGDGVLVAHDGTDTWTPVTRFLIETCGLRVAELTPVDPQSIPSSLSRQRLEESGFAVCILAPDSSISPTRANERLVHYAGFLQGRYGFNRVALLVERGCQTFSNMSGLVRLEFRPGHVQDVLVDLERMLQREGFLQTRSDRS